MKTDRGRKNPAGAGIGRLARMSEDEIAWGIIGTGSIAHRFAGQLSRSLTGRLAAVGSRSVDSARRFGAEFGVDRCYGDYNELLADGNVDAVYIATPHPWHAQWAVRAAEAGKHVLCEKPLTLNHATAMAVVEAARRHDVFLMEAYMYRCHAQTVRVLDLVRAGDIGRVHHIEASFAFRAAPDPASRLYARELGGGGILDVGGYPVSMAYLLAGTDEPARVSAAGHIGETGVDEWATATLQFCNGVTAFVATGVGTGAPNDVRVFGADGYLVLHSPWLPSPDRSSRITVHRAGAEPEEIEVDPVLMYAAEADAVAAHIADRQAPAMPWSHTLATMATLDAWRAGIGLTYDAELPDAVIPPVNGRPLARRSDHTIRHGTVAGIETPISRLVMGVDNQRSLPHATVMFDDFAERGGNCFDTAYQYGGGLMERLLGRWIRNRGMRDEVVIIGKGAHTPYCDPDSLTKQLYQSLDRLGTDHVDLYFMHRDNTDIPVGEFVDVLDEHRRAGRIRAYGGSNWSIERFEAANDHAARNGRQGFAALSNHLSLAVALDVPWAGCRHVSDPESRRWLVEHQVPLFPWSSQARGFFTGRARPDDRSDPELVRCYYSDENFARLARANELAEKYRVPTTAIALAYLLALPFPVFPLIGPRTLDETRTSFAALDVALTPEQIAWLEGGSG